MFPHWARAGPTSARPQWSCGSGPVLGPRCSRPRRASTVRPRLLRNCDRYLPGQWASRPWAARSLTSRRPAEVAESYGLFSLSADDWDIYLEESDTSISIGSPPDFSDESNAVWKRTNGRYITVWDIYHRNSLGNLPLRIYNSEIVIYWVIN
jgi:hypothetical protein